MIKVIMTGTGFSFTAPQISPEDERREREALTEQEREQVHHDLYGSSNTQYNVEEDPEFVCRAHAMLQGALMDIPVEEKADYLEALERVPDLVASETPSLQFMRCDHCNAKVSVQLTFYRIFLNPSWISIMSSYSNPIFFCIFACFFRLQPND